MAAEIEGQIQRRIPRLCRDEYNRTCWASDRPAATRLDLSDPCRRANRRLPSVACGEGLDRPGAYAGAAGLDMATTAGGGAAALCPAAHDARSPGIDRLSGGGSTLARTADEDQRGIDAECGGSGRRTAHYARTIQI